MLFIQSLTQGKRRNYTVRSYSNHADKEIPEDFLGTNVETIKRQYQMHIGQSCY